MNIKKWLSNLLGHGVCDECGKMTHRNILEKEDGLCASCGMKKQRERLSEITQEKQSETMKDELKEDLKSYNFKVTSEFYTNVHAKDVMDATEEVHNKIHNTKMGFRLVENANIHFLGEKPRYKKCKECGSIIDTSDSDYFTCDECGADMCDYDCVKKHECFSEVEE